MDTNSEFRGESKVIIEASRSKGIFYREGIKLEFDGTDLVIHGAHQVFSGQIPVDETTRTKEIGEAIEEAFNNPRRLH